MDSVNERRLVDSEMNIALLCVKVVSIKLFSFPFFPFPTNLCQAMLKKLFINIVNTFPLKSSANFIGLMEILGHAIVGHIYNMFNGVFVCLCRHVTGHTLREIPLVSSAQTRIVKYNFCSKGINLPVKS